MNSKMLKPTILSVSLLTIMASAAVAPALGKIRLAFPAANATLIKLVLTLPPLIIIPFSLLSGWLVYRIKKKTLMITGLLIYLIAGCGGGFARSITELLVIRAILGIGVGLIMPLSTTLVGDFFQGPARSKMMGLAASVQNLGGVIFQIVAGYLAVISWRYSFGVYSMALVILVLIMAWLPEPPRATAQQAQKPKSRLPIGVYFCAFLCVLNMIVFFSVPTNMAILLETEKRLFASQSPLFKDKQDLQQHLQSGTISEITRRAFEDNNIALSEQARIEVVQPRQTWKIIDKDKKYIVKKEGGELVIATGKLGKAAIAGYILSIMSLSAMISGIILSQILALLRRYAVPLAIVLMGTGFWLLGHAANIPMIFAAVIIIGFCFGIIQPFLFVFVQKIAPQDSRALAMAIVGSSIFLGQFLSPIALGAISTISGQSSIFFKYNFCAVALCIAGLLGLALALRPPKLAKA
jgi:MFS family permease